MRDHKVLFKHIPWVVISNDNLICFIVSLVSQDVSSRCKSANLACHAVFFLPSFFFWNGTSSSDDWWGIKLNRRLGWFECSNGCLHSLEDEMVYGRGVRTSSSGVDAACFDDWECNHMNRRSELFGVINIRLEDWEGEQEYGRGVRASRLCGDGVLDDKVCCCICAFVVGRFFSLVCARRKEEDGSKSSSSASSTVGER